MRKAAKLVSVCPPSQTTICPSCNKTFESHLGLLPTCELLKKCRHALTEILCESVDKGEKLDYRKIEKICSVVLSEVNVALF